MDMDPAAIIRPRAFLAELPDDLLQDIDVLILQDRGHQFAGSFPSVGDGDVRFAFPFTSLAVDHVVVVVATPVAGPLGSEDSGDDALSVLSADVVHLDFYSEVLVLDKF